MRTFVCIEISDDIRLKMSQMSATLSESGANARWVKPHNIHLTLIFLGEVLDANISEVCREIEAVAADTGKFSFAVAGLGAFPPGRAPRIVWCGVKEETGALEKLHRKLNAALKDFAQKEDRKRFSPHLTIGRVRGPKRAEALRAAIEKNREAEFGIQIAGEAVLMMSELSPKGPKYTPLSRRPLR